MTAPYIPARRDRGDGYYKLPDELVEYSPTIFDTSVDDADRAFRPSLENCTPDERRARDVAAEVARLLWAKGNHKAAGRRGALVASDDLRRAHRPRGPQA